MGHIEKTIFISYRRKDVPWALAVYQHLAAHGYDVFFDYNSIHSGDFEQIIVGNIRARAHFVLILTPSALERSHEPGDWLRREIEAALREKRNIIPLFFDGFNFADPAVSEKLTGELAALNKYNGFNVHTDYFDAAMEKLREQFLNVELEAVLHPLSQEAQREVQAQKEAADRALQGGEQKQEGKGKEEDELFELGIRAELMGELEKALNFYYRVRKIDPLYPRIERKIEDLENELRKAARPPAQATAPSAPRRNPLVRLAIVGIIAAVGACGLSLAYLGVRAVITPSQMTFTPGITTSSPGTTPTATFVESTDSPQVTTGPWVGQVERLEISVDRVEVIKQVGDRKILRFYTSVSNQTGDSIRLPLFGNFLAIDSAGQTYAADHRLSNWPDSFPAGETVTGSIDLEDLVPEGVSTMKINFSTIFGSVQMVGKSIAVSDIRVP